MAVTVDLDERAFNGVAAGRPDHSQAKRKCEVRGACTAMVVTMQPALQRWCQKLTQSYDHQHTEIQEGSEETLRGWAGYLDFVLMEVHSHTGLWAKGSNYSWTFFMITVYVSVCVYVCVHVWVYMYLCTCICVHICMSMCVGLFYVYACLCMSLYACVCVHMCIQVFKHICMYVFM